MWVPDTTHEALRDLVRARVDASMHLMRARQQLLAFLLRHGRSYASALSVVKIIIGFCVLFGFGSRYVYVVGLMLIASLTFGAALRQDWDSAGLQLIYALLYAILLASREYNVISVDGWLAPLQGRGNL